MKRNKQGQFVKGGGGRRRRRRKRNGSPAAEPNPSRRRRRRRRSSGGGGRPRRRRRRNGPSEGGGKGFQPHKSFDFKDLLPYVLSTLAQAFVVQRWGDMQGVSFLTGQRMNESFWRGQPWTLRNYLLGLATAWAGSKVLARTGMMGGAAAARIWWRAGIENMVTRLVWTEGISRWKWGREHFGNLPAGCQPGQVYDDGNGNRWLCAQNGQWVSMQGPLGYGELVQAGPLGYGELVQAGPLGYGELVQAGPLGADVSGGFQPLGHLLSNDTDKNRNDHAENLRLGSRDPWAASLMNAA